CPVMLFLLKRSWQTAVPALVVLTGLGLLLRWLLASDVELSLSLPTLALGVLVFLCVVCSDVLLHGLFLLLFGDSYRRRHNELVGVFRGQTVTALLAGALMAGIGEELVFRGLSSSPVYLAVSALVFGLLHHVRRSLWPFTLWAVWQGVLFAVALGWT